jgi:tRNA 2-thiocytidine biosynthesis protein TtcA
MVEHYIPLENIVNHSKSNELPVAYKKLEKKLLRLTGQAIHDFSMIQDGDRVMVCLSGGKDSYTMLELLRILKKRAPIRFDLIAVNLDQKQPGFPEEILPTYLDKLGVEYDIIQKDTYSIVKDKIPEGKTTCGLCSRLRRGILYNYAKSNRITKIALGHHKDDIVETFFLNLFFGGSLKSMPAKLKSDDGENIVIRPLAYISEKDIIKYSDYMKFPIIPCNLCGSQENLQRKNIKKMISDWEIDNKGRKDIIFKALQNISPSQLLDRERYNFDF